MFKVINLCLALYLTTITMIFTLSKREQFLAVAMPSHFSHSKQNRLTSKFDPELL